MSKVVVSVIHEGGCTEIQWGHEEPVHILGYALINEDGTLTIPFRTDEDDPFVFVLDENRARIVASEDQLPPYEGELVVWESQP